jgi:2-dehydropantoate 2-reductase
MPLVPQRHEGRAGPFASGAACRKIEPSEARAFLARRGRVQLKIAIIGVGAIGGYLGARLAHAGEDVTFIARGTNLEALQTRGIRLVMGDGSELSVPRVKATADYAAAGPQDLVILALKAHQVAAVALDVPKLFGPDTAVVPMQNGIPYWYFHAHGGALSGTRVRTVDPDGVIAEHIPGDRVVGCVVYPATELLSPGVIKHVEGNRFPVGELDGSSSERVQRISECFARCGLQAPVLGDIRAEIWLKLWGNMTFNPISALARATLAGICQYPPSRELAHAMMTEAQSIAGKLGITFRVPIEKRIAGAERVGHHKTSMLQDVEAGRPLETDALLGSVIELARLTDTPTPHLDTVYALTKLLEKSLEEARPQLGSAR